MNQYRPSRRRACLITIFFVFVVPALTAFFVVGVTLLYAGLWPLP